MNDTALLDSSAWMENFSGTKAGIHVENMLKQKRCFTTMVTLAELADKFSRENIPFQKYHEYIKSKSAILPLTEEIAVTSGTLKKKLRETAPDTSLIDAINLATAQKHNAQLITCDTDFTGARNTLVIKK